jgi:mRNA-degrading endonuclease RelE of RelBE toxin-antitoxin system
MSYDVELADQAKSRLKKMDRSEALRILRKLSWLAENAAVVEHDRLTNPPPRLAGVCKHRVGPYRVIYWVDHVEERISVVDIVMRREKYKDLYR